MPGMAEELVVQERPDQGPHLARIALDLLRFVHPVDQDDDARVAQRVEHALRTCAAARIVPRRRRARPWAAAGRPARSA